MIFSLHDQLLNYCCCYQGVQRVSKGPCRVWVKDQFVLFELECLLTCSHCHPQMPRGLVQTLQEQFHALQVCTAIVTASQWLQTMELLILLLLFCSVHVKHSEVKQSMSQ